MKKAFSNLTLMVLAAGLLAGCGGSDSTTSEASSSTSQAPTTTSPSTATKYKISLVYSGVSEASEYVDLNATATSAEDKKVTGNRLKVVPGTPFQVLLEASAGSTYAIGIEKQNMTGDKYCGLTTMAGTVTGDMIVTMVCKPPHKEIATQSLCSKPSEPATGFGPVFKGCEAGVPAYYPSTECQKDYSTGLIWEVKSPDLTSSRSLDRQFILYRSGPGSASTPLVEDYLTAMNVPSTQCGGTWRLPTADEVRTFILSTSVTPTLGRLAEEGPFTRWGSGGGETSGIVTNIYQTSDYRLIDGRPTNYSCYRVFVTFAEYRVGNFSNIQFDDRLRSCNPFNELIKVRLVSTGS